MITRFQIHIIPILLLVMSIFLAACQARPENTSPADEQQLKVVATTTFVGDIVGSIAGDKIDLKVLLEPGQNPHSFLVSPRDMVSLTEADLLFVNGFGLEEFLDELLEGSDFPGSLVIVSEGISPRVIEGGLDEIIASDHPGVDPHVWLNPNNIKIWVDNIAGALIKMDSGNADYYLDNADIYLQELEDLDLWIRAELDDIPEENRELVSDHSSLGYFADEYGLRQIGAVIPAMTTEAETSGQQLAVLIETIRDQQVKAIFVGVDFDPTLAQRVSDETDIELVMLYFGSLSDGPPADTYLNFMRYNIKTIVSALK
jgi:ABC-type Zn uptake system ZnuABC Zn-binding protein ZnuA